MNSKILFIVLISQLLFGSEMNITKEDMIWRMKLSNVGHGILEQEWARRVTMPGNCEFGKERKLFDIKTISLNTLNKKPEDWLQGKYLLLSSKNAH